MWRRGLLLPWPRLPRDPSCMTWNFVSLRFHLMGDFWQWWSRGREICSCIPCCEGFRGEILAVQLVEFFGDAKVHDDLESGDAGAFGGRFVDHAFLHPDCAGADFNCAIDDFGDEFRAAEDVHDVDFVWDVFQ